MPNSAARERDYAIDLGRNRLSLAYVAAVPALNN